MNEVEFTAAVLAFELAVVCASIVVGAMYGTARKVRRIKLHMIRYEWGYWLPDEYGRPEFHYGKRNSRDIQTFAGQIRAVIEG